MSVAENVKRIVNDQGRTQVWVVNQMNNVAPALNMDSVKFSAIVTGNRKMTGDELLAFCKALQINPDEFLE